MHKYFGKETVTNLFINGGSVIAVTFSLGSVVLLVPGSDLKAPTMVVAVGGLITSIAGLVVSVGNQIVNILKVIKEHEIINDDIIANLKILREEIENVSRDHKETVKYLNDKFPDRTE